MFAQSSMTPPSRRRKPRPRQLELRLPTHGGRRAGAGRKRTRPRPGVPHRRRPEFARRSPLHITIRMADGVWNLRSRRSFTVIERALRVAADRFDVRVLRFAVLGNHAHFLVEAPDQSALSRAMKGFAVRLARGLNKMMGRRGRVLDDRYHAHRLRTPTEVRRAIDYIRHNRRRHLLAVGERLPAGWLDPYSSESPVLAIVLPAPLTWLVREGWRRGRPGLRAADP
jgi:REP-associated tyrosine transposase